MQKRTWAMLAFAVGGALLVESAPTQDPVVNPAESAEKTKAFMRTKLKYSQQIFEGIMLRDFNSVAKGAEQLKLLSFDSGWQVLQTEEYVLHSRNFRQAADYLARAAAATSEDAGVLGYFRMTQNCVDCHRHVRHQAR